ncbi:hypothetical protein DAPPUDRAFT_313583 [Daphnia pulex]|uniref:Uncharacterized protein n=1 Tax=Daphnia pulex TaxID=6669 RepID=E9G3J1_DAPPU|nr:hypothetical protein DAPPUDRAFT_313583 [Daphnia pulex]|eukprot:EFX85977.1 hypothetical protein DAPPUDRAFT_313583 [Daphnia pulex]
MRCLVLCLYGDDFVALVISKFENLQVQQFRHFCSWTPYTSLEGIDCMDVATT